MKYKISSLKITGLLVSICLMLSYATLPPEGNTNAPGEGFCGNCHTPSPSLNGSIVFKYPDIIIKDSVYDLSISLIRASSSVIKGGFQLVALQADEEGTAGLSNAGEFVPVPLSNTSISPEFAELHGRQYLGHGPAIQFSGDTLTYHAKWKASFVTDQNPGVTFYLAVNFANGNDQSSGDRPKEFNFSATVLPLSKPSIQCLSGPQSKKIGFEILGDLSEIRSAQLQNSQNGKDWYFIRDLQIRSGNQLAELSRDTHFAGEYFRMKLEAFDGEIIYSDLIRCAQISVAQNFQNPFQDEIVLDSRFGSPSAVIAYDSRGQTIPIKLTGTSIRFLNDYKGLVFLSVDGIVSRLLRY